MSLKPTVTTDVATDVADDDEEEGALERTSSANPSLLSRYCFNSTRLC